MAKLILIPILYEVKYMFYLNVRFLDIKCIKMKFKTRFSELKDLY